MIPRRLESALLERVFHRASHKNREVGRAARNERFDFGGDVNAAGDDGIGQTHYIGSDIVSSQREHILEGRGLSLAPGERLATGAEELAYSGDDGGVLVVTIVDDGAGRNARRDEDGGNAYAEAGEV